MVAETEGLCTECGHVHALVDARGPDSCPNVGQEEYRLAHNLEPLSSDATGVIYGLMSPSGRVT